MRRVYATQSCSCTSGEVSRQVCFCSIGMRCLHVLQKQGNTNCTNEPSTQAQSAGGQRNDRQTVQEKIRRQ